MLGFFVGMFVTSIFLAMFAVVMLWRDSYYAPRHSDNAGVYDWAEKGL